MNKGKGREGPWGRALLRELRIRLISAAGPSLLQAIREGVARSPSQTSTLRLQPGLTVTAREAPR